PDTGISRVPLADLDANVLPTVATQPAPAAASRASAPPGSLEQLLPTLDPEPGFIGLSDMDTLTSTQLTVRVKGAIGTALHLRLNGQRVPESRVRRPVSPSTAGSDALEYVRLELPPGVNRLELSAPHTASPL